MNYSVSGFEIYLSQLEVCCRNKLSIPSLFMALPIPDIGGSVDGEGNHEKRYVRWANKCCGFDKDYARTLYHLRCDLLHGFGSTNNRAIRKRLIFTFPELSERLRLHSVTVQSGEQQAIVLDSILLSEHICKAARSWYLQVERDVDKQFEIQKMLRIYPGGIAPFIVGQPVIGFGHQNRDAS
jgi:hypothetical protein